MLFVIGLVKKPGFFPYPQGGQCNLAQALAFVRGVDETPDARYVKVLRQDPRGKIIAGVFKIGLDRRADAYAINIKQGNVIPLDHTARSNPADPRRGPKDPNRPAYRFDGNRR